MTSKELVKRTLDFSSPLRIPRQLWLLPWAGDHYPEELAQIQKRFPDDLITSPSFYREPLKTAGDEYSPGTYFDEWGCRFENRQKGVIGEVKEPLLKDWRDIDALRIPRERLSLDSEKVNEFCRCHSQFVLSRSCARPFEQLQFIRAPENLYLDLADQPSELVRLLQRIHHFYCEEMEIWARTEVDALVFSDDWGGQNSLLISPSLWRKMFRPLYQDYVDIARRRGKYIFMHSDGWIMDILPDLVEIGVDALNAQLFCMNIEELGRRFKGKMTFWGEIDRQYLLSFGKTEEVRAAVKRVKESLYQDGGIIAQCEFGAGARPENVAAVFLAWEEFQASP
jgi:uroporphyrinogen decarboxylase